MKKTKNILLIGFVTLFGFAVSSCHKNNINNIFTIEDFKKRLNEPNNINKDTIRELFKTIEEEEFEDQDLDEELKDIKNTQLLDSFTKEEKDKVLQIYKSLKVEDADNEAADNKGESKESVKNNNDENDKSKFPKNQVKEQKEDLNNEKDSIVTIEAFKKKLEKSSDIDQNKIETFFVYLYKEEFDDSALKEELEDIENSGILDSFTKEEKDKVLQIYKSLKVEDADNEAADNKGESKESVKNNNCKINEIHVVEQKEDLNEENEIFLKQNYPQFLQSLKSLKKNKIIDNNFYHEIAKIIYQEKLDWNTIYTTMDFYRNDKVCGYPNKKLLNFLRKHTNISNIMKWNIPIEQHFSGKSTKMIQDIEYLLIENIKALEEFLFHEISENMKNLYETVHSERNTLSRAKANKDYSLRTKIDWKILILQKEFEISQNSYNNYKFKNDTVEKYIKQLFFCYEQYLKFLKLQSKNIFSKEMIEEANRSGIMEKTMFNTVDKLMSHLNERIKDNYFTLILNKIKNLLEKYAVYDGAAKNALYKIDVLLCKFNKDSQKELSNITSKYFDNEKNFSCYYDLEKYIKSIKESCEKNEEKLNFINLVLEMIKSIKYGVFRYKIELNKKLIKFVAKPMLFDFGVFDIVISEVPINVERIPLKIYPPLESNSKSVASEFEFYCKLEKNYINIGNSPDKLIEFNTTINKLQINKGPNSLYFVETVKFPEDLDRSIKKHLGNKFKIGNTRLTGLILLYILNKNFETIMKIEPYFVNNFLKNIDFIKEKLKMCNLYPKTFKKLKDLQNDWEKRYEDFLKEQKKLETEVQLVKSDIQNCKYDNKLEKDPEEEKKKKKKKEEEYLADCYIKNFLTKIGVPKNTLKNIKLDGWKNYFKYEFKNFGLDPFQDLKDYFTIQNFIRLDIKLEEYMGFVNLINETKFERYLTQINLSDDLKSITIVLCFFDIIKDNAQTLNFFKKEITSSKYLKDFFNYKIADLNPGKLFSRNKIVSAINCQFTCRLMTKALIRDFLYFIVDTKYYKDLGLSFINKLESFSGKQDLSKYYFSTKNKWFPN